MNQLPFKAAIFDLDGTLLDSMSVWSDVDVKFLSKRGFEVPSFYVNELSAKSFDEAAVYTIDLFNLNETVEAVQAEWLSLAEYEYAHNVKLKPYGREYLARLKEQGVKLAVATGLTVRLMESALKHNGIYDVFDVIVSADEVGSGKSSPEIFLETAARLGEKPCDCAAFEDIPQAIRSIKQAGMTAYAMYDSYSKKSRDILIKESDGYFYDFSEAPLFYN